MSTAAAIHFKTFFLDEFAERQWEPDHKGTVISFDKTEFTKRVEEAFDNGTPLVDGYAPFCKHIFVENFVGAKAGALKITPDNEHLLKSAYNARTPAELPVLTRWFPAEAVEAKEAKMLDVILYSNEQLVKERDAMADKSDSRLLPGGVPWGIISIKAQDESHELPMEPITMMRNALGREEGGSGVPLERSKYDASVAYWREHAPIVASN